MQAQTFKIRPVTLEDAIAIQELARAALGYPADIDLVREQIQTIQQASDHVAFVAVHQESGQVVGYIEGQIYRALYSETGFNAIGLAVSPTWQGKGIGQQLLTHIENHARSLGLAFVRLNSCSHRQEAHAFYLAQGYDGDKMQRRFMKEL